jgi:hypothetical protein
VAGQLPSRRGGGRSSFEVPAWFVPAARFFFLLTNRTVDSGSMPEAVRRTVRLPECPEALRERLRQVLAPHLAGVDVVDGLPVCPESLRETILQRQIAGQPLVPERLAMAIRVSKSVVRYHRNPTDAGLDMINAAGCLKFGRRDGEYVPLRSGDRMMPDDGSINFCCWVPWGFEQTGKCAKRFGCLVGRWQLLLFVDAASLSIRARSFVARPRSSYRQEDALHLYNVFMREHGLPREIWHEGGVWNSGRVKDCLDLLGVGRQLLHSPHTKTQVEGRFNKLWTVLSVLSGGQIGRYRGEMEAENRILTSCRDGATDPRKVFPGFAEALSYIDQAIAEANATPVDTDVGRFVPDALWSEQLAAQPLRRLGEDHAWMFWPVCETRTVTGGGLTITLPMFEDFSVPFTFAAEWIPQFRGARVKTYFDPWMEGRCHGVAVLEDAWEGHRAGEVLGTMMQTNDIGSYARAMLGIGHGPDDMGRVIAQRQAAALRSARRAIVPNGRGAAVMEVRDGVLESERAEVDGAGGGERTGGRMRLPARPVIPASGPAQEDPRLAEMLAELASD